MAPSHGGIQQAAPGTKHCPAPPQRRSVLKGGALHSFIRPPTNTMRDRVLSFPHLSGSPSIDQPISSATGSLLPSAPTHSVLAGSAPLLLLCQLYLQLTCPPPSLGLHPHRSLRLSSPLLFGPCGLPPPLDPPAVHLPTALPFPLQEWPSQFLECLVRKPSQAQFFRRPTPTGRIQNQSIIIPFLDTQYVSLALPNALHLLPYLIFMTTLPKGIIVIPILQRRKLRPKNVK